MPNPNLNPNPNPNPNPKPDSTPKPKPNRDRDRNPNPNLNPEDLAVDRFFPWLSFSFSRRLSLSRDLDKDTFKEDKDRG